MIPPIRRLPPGALTMTIFLCLTAPAAAGALPLPATATAAKQAIAEDCPECVEKGVTPCGTADLQVGKRFARSFFAGRPARGYLPGFRMDAGEFATLARMLPYAGLMDSLRARFLDTPLVIVEGDFVAARVVAKPSAVDIIFPQPLHQCLADKTMAWGCCVTDCQHECCEKSLGSPRIDLQWDDAESGDRLTFHYSNTLGSSTLARETAAGKTTLYWCLTGEAGRLQ
jgi:hypothetical protein